ncbi:MAG: aldo/keto reductase [Alphaproteobacteria bacterium]
MAGRMVEARGGMMMPALGLGTWKMGRDSARRKSEIAALQLGIDLGVAMIDTAEMYDDAESVVGEAIAGRREGLFIVSKVLPSNASRKGTIEACERSLRKLKTDRLDLYLLHWEGSYPLEETYASFAELLRAGKIRHFGVSNFDAGKMAESEGAAGGTQVASNQVMYSLARRGIERKLIPWCRARKVSLMAYSPLDQGGLKAKPALAAIARRHGVALETVAIAWTMRDPLVCSIPKASNAEHVRANAAARDLVLAPEDLAELDRAYPAPARDVPLDMS